MNRMCSSKEEAAEFLQKYGTTIDQIKRELIQQNFKQAEGDFNEEMAEITTAINEDDSGTRDDVDPMTKEEIERLNPFFSKMEQAKGGDMSYDMVQIAVKMQYGIMCSDSYWHSVCAVILSS